jgi:hypothetical protein
LLEGEEVSVMCFTGPRTLKFILVLALLLTLPPLVTAQPTRGNSLCPGEDVFYNPDNGNDIVVPPGFTKSRFVTRDANGNVKDLNFPTGIAFLGNARKFDIYVLESGHGLPSRCNDEQKWQTMGFPGNPFTPDILVFDQSGKQIRGPLGKPDAATTSDAKPVTNSFQPHGPAVDIAFEKGLAGGRLFATDSNQSTHEHNGPNNTSRIVTVDPFTGVVTPFITQLPTGDHPTEQLAFKDGWIYWSQGSTTNSGVVGHDNGGGLNQQDIPCQDITLSRNLFDSGDGHFTSGYSPHGTKNPGGTVKAFASASHHGVCDGAILRARLNAAQPENTIQPFSWGYRNGYAIRFPPANHTLNGGLLVGEDGADERGARPSSNAPDGLHLAQLNADGSPDYHGWPDRYGFLNTSQAVFNPVGGPGDDLCVSPFPPTGAPCTAASVARILLEDVPIRDVLAFPPQPITAPLAIEAADSSFTGIDFVPDTFAISPVKRGAVLYALEGDFGFSKANASAPQAGTPDFGTPAAEVGHEIKLINFSPQDQPFAMKIMRFSHNNTNEQAFVSGISGYNRPTQLRMGPDGCAWITDYGAVRDFGQSDPDAGFKVPADAPLVQIPGTGVIWRICPIAQAGGGGGDNDNSNDRGDN